MRRQRNPFIHVVSAGAMTLCLSALLLLAQGGGRSQAHGAESVGQPRAGAGSVLSVGESYTVFLPIVFGPTPQPPPPPIIANGDFESGRVEWNIYSTASQALIHPAPELPSAPYSGQWAARLGNRDQEVSMLSQAVAIPPDRACLVYWQWIVSNDSCNVDFGGVGVNGKWVQPYSLCVGTSTARWARQQISMTKFVSTPMTPTVVLNFAVTTDYSLPSALYVDAISFEPTTQCADVVSTHLQSHQTHTMLLDEMVGLPIDPFGALDLPPTGINKNPSR